MMQTDIYTSLTYLKKDKMEHRAEGQPSVKAYEEERLLDPYGLGPSGNGVDGFPQIAPSSNSGNRAGRMNPGLE